MDKQLDFIATTRENGNSLIITIPKNICKYFTWTHKQHGIKEFAKMTP